MNFVRAKERSTNTLFSYVCLRDVTRNDSKIGRRVCVAGRATLCDHGITCLRGIFRGNQVRPIGQPLQMCVVVMSFMKVHDTGSARSYITIKRAVFSKCYRVSQWNTISSIYLRITSNYEIW